MCCQYQYALRPNYSGPYEVDPVYFDTVRATVFMLSHTYPIRSPIRSCIQWGNVGVLMLETRSPTTFLEKDSPLTDSGVKEEMLGQRQVGSANISFCRSTFPTASTHEHRRYHSWK